MQKEILYKKMQKIGIFVKNISLKHKELNHRPLRTENRFSFYYSTNNTNFFSISRLKTNLMPQPPKLTNSYPNFSFLSHLSLIKTPNSIASK
jgi:hypothetical protein